MVDGLMLSLPRLATRRKPRNDRSVMYAGSQEGKEP